MWLSFNSISKTKVNIAPMITDTNNRNLLYIVV